MPFKQSLKDKVSQLFIVGFDGYSVPDDVRQFMRKYPLGGVIYFKRNVQSASQLLELSNELQCGARPAGCPPLFISIDHEGGRVNRLSEPFTPFPSSDRVGALGSPKVAFELGVALARELKAVGVNINYAPVVDVNSNPQSPVIGARAFSADPEVCGKMGSAVCRGLQKMGVMAVAKHFPGHGDTELDSHYQLPQVNKSAEQLEALEFIPFRRVIRSRVEGIMTAHILNPQLDPEYPATLSKSTLTGLLRETLRFTRLIISDDLEMKAIADHYDPLKTAVLAVGAGCDLLIYRGDNGLPEAQIEAIVHAVEKGEIPQGLLDAAVRRIEAAKKLYATQDGPLSAGDIPTLVGLPEHSLLAETIALQVAKP